MVRNAVELMGLVNRLQNIYLASLYLHNINIPVRPVAMEMLARNLKRPPTDGEYFSHML